MEFSINFAARKAIGLLTAIMALTALFMCVTVAEGAGIAFLLLFASALAVVSIAVFTATNVVIVDKEKQTVEKRFGAIVFSRNQRYRFSDFSGVGIMMAGRDAAQGGAITVYFAQLLGKTNLKLPAGSTNKAEILSRAKEVAEYMSLPLDENPGMGFFGKRL